MAENGLQFGRLIPAMVTPFDCDKKLDLKRAQELAVRLIDGGCDSLLVCGTTGESPTVFYDQKLELFKAVIEAVDGRVPIIANVGDNCTADSVSFAKEAVELGMDGIMCVVPYYNKPPQEGLYLHFASIANALPDTPIILYNIPGRCVINMQPTTTLRLANDCHNIIAIKEASGDIEQIKTICEAAPQGFNVYSGDDEMTLDVMRVGGIGVISTIANVCPSRMKEVIDAEVAGDQALADSLFAALQPLMEELFVTANPIMVKEALRLLKFDVGGLRLPLVEATDDQSAALARIMEQVGVI